MLLNPSNGPVGSQTALHGTETIRNMALVSLSFYFVAQLVNNQPSIQETRVRFLGWDDPVEKEMATHCSILAWRIPWTEEPGGLRSLGWHKVGHD